MNADKPRVSVGLPVFNGEKYLEEALDSILAQTCRDFELIISDNASTDRTQPICRTYAAKDSRIHYHRNEKNVGASQNHNFTFKASSSPYFKWSAHDDIMAPDFLLKCINVLDHDPSIALCHSNTRIIDEHGKSIGIYNHALKIDSHKPHERFGDLISSHKAWCTVFGVMRSNILRKTPLMGDYISSDMTLLAEIGLFGRIYEIPEYLFFRRDHPQSYTHTYYANRRLPNYREQLSWWNIHTAKEKTIILPTWRICSEYVKSVNRAPLKWSEFILCYKQIGKWLMKVGLLNMARDVDHAFLQSSYFGRRISSVIKRIIKRGN